MKTVLITGCSSGFGQLMVPLFLERGWRVFATLRKLHGESFDNLINLSKSHPQGRLQILELDVCLSESRQMLKERLFKDSEAGLSCLVNNAGVGLFGPFEPTSETQLRGQFETNFFGPAFLIQDLLPLLRIAKGRIINISSVFGFSAFPMASGYCASKFALEGLSESLALELKQYGIQISLVEPGAHRTNFSKNVTWVRGKNLIYEQQTEGHYAMYRMLSEGKPTPGSRVAKKVMDLAEMKRMPLRVPVGKDAKFAWWSKRLLPQSWLMFLQAKMIQIIYSKARAMVARVGV